MAWQVSWGHVKAIKQHHSVSSEPRKMAGYVMRMQDGWCMMVFFIKVQNHSLHGVPGKKGCRTFCVKDSWVTLKSVRIYHGFLQDPSSSWCKLWLNSILPQSFCMEQIKHTMCTVFDAELSGISTPSCVESTLSFSVSTLLCRNDGRM